MKIKIRNDTNVDTKMSRIIKQYDGISDLMNYENNFLIFGIGYTIRR